MINEIEKALSDIDFSEYKLDGYSIIGLLEGGMNNVIYLLIAHGVKYVVYLPTPNCNDIVNRQDEHRNLQAIAPLKISRTNIYHNSETGVKINTFVEGKSLEKLSKYPYAKIAKVLKILHNSSITLASDYQPFKKLDEYEAQAHQTGLEFDERYWDIKAKLSQHKTFLQAQKLVPAHNDPQPSNIIYDGKAVTLIDFEFAANNDYIYDLACFANLKLEDGLRLLKEYEGADYTLEKEKRFYLWRIFQCLQWHNVALIKLGSGLNAIMPFDFREVANTYLNLAINLYNDYFK